MLRALSVRLVVRADGDSEAIGCVGRILGERVRCQLPI